LQRTAAWEHLPSSNLITLREFFGCDDITKQWLMPFPFFLAAQNRILRRWMAPIASLLTLGTCILNNDAA
jgi:hypothetical protein